MQKPLITSDVVVLMDKIEAKEKDERIILLTGTYATEVGQIALEMRERDGWKALGFKSWPDYCRNVDDRVGKNYIQRAVTKAEVERNLQMELPLTHALALGELDDPEAQRQVYALVTSEYENPIARNFETYVDRYLRQHEKSRRASKNGSDGDGWTHADLEEDKELADALRRIGEIWGSRDKTAIQDGTIGMSRKDIVSLAKFPVQKMKEVQYLIMSFHWDLERALKFVNTQLTEKEVEPLINHCLGTAGLYYTCSVAGFDISIRACAALTKKIKG